MILTPDTPHQPLLTGFTIDEIQLLVDENPYLRGYLQGYLAEKQLKAILLDVPGVRGVVKIPDAHPMRGDLLIDYKGYSISLECKSIDAKYLKHDPLNQSWEARVCCKSTDRKTFHIEGVGQLSSVHLPKGEFDILGICTYPLTGRWDFFFLENHLLPEADDKPGYIKTKFLINTAVTPGLTSDPVRILDEICAQKDIVKC